MKAILFYKFAILSNSSSSLNNKGVKFDGLISVNLLFNKSFLTRSYTVLSPFPLFSYSPFHSSSLFPLGSAPRALCLYSFLSASTGFFLAALYD